MKNINKKYCFIAPRRSGHHAIIEWFSKQIPNDIHFLNDNDHAWGRPIRFPKVENGQLEYLNNQYKTDKVEIGDKDLIYNYEDRLLSSFNEPQHLKELENNDANIIILRDPFNLIASRMKHWVEKKPELLQNGINLWVEYAEEILGVTNIIPNKHIILYNQWFTDANYRKTIVAWFNGKHDDSCINIVPEWGRGSTFDGLNYQNNASQMKVLERYKTIEDKDFLSSLIVNEIFQNHTETIFGGEIITEIKNYLNG